MRTKTFYRRRNNELIDQMSAIASLNAGNDVCEYALDTMTLGGLEMEKDQEISSFSNGSFSGFLSICSAMGK
jgi:hypothetical protein